MQPSKTATNVAVRHYLGELWRQRKYTLPAFLLVSIGAVFSTYIPPLIVAAMIKHFSNHVPDLHSVLPYLGAFAAVWLIGEALWRGSFLFLNRADSNGMQHLYDTGLALLLKKDLQFFHNNFAGSLTKKVLGYGRNFEMFMDTLTFNVAQNVFPIIFVSIILWQFSPWIVLALYVLMAIVALLIMPLVKRRKKLVDTREEAANHMAGHVADVIGNIDAVQAFAHQNDEQKRHQQNLNDYMKKARRAWDYHTIKIDSLISPIYVFINVTGLALATLLSDNTSTITAIFISFNYFAFITQIVWGFNRTYRNLESSIADAAQFTELLLAPSLIADPLAPKPFTVRKGTIDFTKVHFAYQAGGKSLFADLNLNIQPGEKIALVGHSGGGKTTVTKMLLRFIDVDSGAVSIDGQDIRESRLADVRSAIAYVPQEPLMFHRTIRENIRYGNPKASDAAVLAAAKKANAHEFISQLPDGYETLVGERGVKLSGGQRQRIAIARAIIKDAPILVLDEATSALDSESEKLIQSALWQLMQGRTALVIAHRLSTIQKMDRIIVLEKGSIAEQGTHEQLTAQKGIYAKLWAHQSGGFIEE